MPEKYGPYRIVRKLGQGGMGTVYEGEHETTGERCAIKVLADWITNAPDEPRLAEFRRLFQEEISTLNQMTHVNIVRLSGFGEQEGRLFYTMELIDGPNLQEMLRDGYEFTWGEVVEIAVQVCAALKHAHDRGILHRDLKPANLIWSDAGKGPIKLADFGIARHALDQLTEEVIGTADYMSPEQAASRPVNARSDLYSLGSVMYTLLTKRPPFRGPSKTQILDDLQRQTPLPLGRLVFGLPEELELIVNQLLEKEAQNRIATASILGKRLRALLHAHRQGKLLDTDPDAEPDDSDDEFDVGPAEGSRPTQIGATRVEKTQISPSDAEDADDANNDEDPTQGGGETLLVAGSATEVAAPAAPTTSFTHVDGEQQSFPHKPEPAHDASDRGTWLATVGIVVTALALCGLAWWLSQPPNPDEVFQRIAAVAAKGDHSQWVEVRPKIDNFLRDYPKDTRRGQVEAWRSDHEWYKHWRMLERQAKKDGGIKFLDTNQQLFVLASRQDNAGNRKEAIHGYEQFLAQTTQQDLPEARHANHRLAELRQDD